MASSLLGPPEIYEDATATAKRAATAAKKTATSKRTATATAKSTTASAGSTTTASAGSTTTATVENTTTASAGITTAANAGSNTTATVENTTTATVENTTTASAESTGTATAESSTTATTEITTTTTCSDTSMDQLVEKFKSSTPYKEALLMGVPENFTPPLPTGIVNPRLPRKKANKKKPPPMVRRKRTNTKKPRRPKVENYNNRAIWYPPRMLGLTENRSPTFLSTGNPCLDFFFHVVPDTPPESLRNLLQLAWDHDPLKALKLVCHLRGVRGTGKSDKEGFYTAALWLHHNHPKTLASNVASLAEFGYFKDLPEILFRLVQGADARELEKKAWETKKSQVETLRSKQLEWESMKEEKARRKVRGQRRWWGMRMNMMSRFTMFRRVTNFEVTTEKRKLLKGGSKKTPQEKRIEQAKRVVEKFNCDPDFKFLHERISDFFALLLRSDMKLLNAGETNNISLAAKWCPSLDSSFDRSTLLCEAIGKKVFPRDEYPEYEGVEDAHYAYRVRDRLRKQVLVPLRKVLQLPEVYIGANDWSSIPYNRVASVAMKLYKKDFINHDRDRFYEYLAKVRSGEAKIAAGALLPHEIIAALDDGDEDGGEVAELQWKKMVDDISKKGALNNCLAISDVSGSMFGIPMEVSVALGVLVSELSEEPWKGKLITFSASPQLQMVEGDSLKEKTKFVREMEWGMNTNFQMVFDLILKVAVNGKLKADDMIKTLFVFSDMEFDQASQNPWETDYQAIVRKFKESGYGEECVPEIVFWNLRDSKATPVLADQKGVALVSGYSKNLLTLFLEKGGALDPEAVMEHAISGEEYQKLVVVD